MGTRATYEFNRKEKYDINNVKTTCYIHWDGYPEGAAIYFNNMHFEKGKSNVEKFIRANEGASITISHEVHGDTEFQYTLVNDELTAYELVYEDEFENRKQQVIFSGDYHEFINKYNKLCVDNCEKGFNKFFKIKIHQSEDEQYYTIPELNSYVEKLKEKYEDYKTNYSQFPHNIESKLEEINYYMHCLIQIMEKYADELENKEEATNEI